MPRRPSTDRDFPVNALRVVEQANMADMRCMANFLWIGFLACALLICFGLGVTFLYFLITIHLPSDPIWPFLLAITWLLSVAGMAFRSIRKRIQARPIISN